MTGDRMIRFVTASAVLTVAVIAGVISYGHIEYLALTNGQTLLASRLLPASVDGVVVVSSMVMLDSARRGVPVPALARVMLVLAILATLAANSAVGAAHGVIGILVSAWPAVAFIGCAETFLAMIRVQPGAASEGALEAVPESVLEAMPERACQAAAGTPGALSLSASGPRTPNRAPEAVFAQELSAGTVPGIRAIKRKCKVGQDTAKSIQQRLATLVSEPAESMN